MELDTIIADAIAELEEQMRNGCDPDEIISEITDSAVPVYNYDILDIIRENSNLWAVESEIGPAFDGSITVVNVAAGVIYEAIEEALHFAVYEIRADLEEEQEEAEESEAEGTTT